MNLLNYALFGIFVFSADVTAKIPPYSTQEIEALNKIAGNKTSINSLDGIKLRLRGNVPITKGIDYLELAQAANTIPDSKGKPCKVYAFIAFYSRRQNKDQDKTMLQGTQFRLLKADPYPELSEGTILTRVSVDGAKNSENVHAGNVLTVLYLQRLNNDGTVASPSELEAIGAYSCRELTAFELLVFTKYMLGPIIEE